MLWLVLHVIFSRRGWRDAGLPGVGGAFFSRLVLDPSLGLSSWSYSASPGAAPTQGPTMTENQSP